MYFNPTIYLFLIIWIFLHSNMNKKTLLPYILSVKMLNQSYWQILPGAASGQYPASPPKVAFALHQPPSLKKQEGDASRSKEARSVSAVAEKRIEDENSSISSSSASSTFSPGEEDVPPFLTGQRSHLLQAPTQNGQNCETNKSDNPQSEQCGEKKLQSSDGESANLSSPTAEMERRRRSQPSVENSSCCCESDLYPKYQFYESDANETNVADSDSILSGNNKSNGLSSTLFSGIQSRSMQGSRKCSLTESRSASASIRINSSVISSRLFNPETLDSSVMTS